MFAYLVGVCVDCVDVELDDLLLDVRLFEKLLVSLENQQNGDLLKTDTPNVGRRTFICWVGIVPEAFHRPCFLSQGVTGMVQERRAANYTIYDELTSSPSMKILTWITFHRKCSIIGVPKGFNPHTWLEFRLTSARETYMHMSQAFICKA